MYIGVWCIPIYNIKQKLYVPYKIDKFVEVYILCSRV